MTDKFELFKLKFYQEELDTKFQNMELSEIIDRAYQLGMESEEMLELELMNQDLRNEVNELEDDVRRLEERIEELEAELAEYEAGN